jgi:Ca2+ transporting ATPase
MFIESFADTTLIVLIVSAVVSLAVGLYEDPDNGWIEGGAILFAVVLVALVTATNNFRKEAQFRKLNSVKVTLCS